MFINLRVFGLLIVLACVSLVLGACGSDTPTATPIPAATATPTLATTPTPAGTEIRIPASADASLIEDAEGARADSIDAAGNFVGMTNNNQARRMLVSFDLSSIPAGSEIASVRLEMHMSRTAGEAAPVSLYLVTTTWSEGTSDARGEGGRGAESTPGDPTWIHAGFDNLFWHVPGGDYVEAASATSSIGRPGEYEWESDALKADVQSWLDDPSTNFGWIAIGDELRTKTAKRFDSRENDDEGLRPTLVVALAP